MKMQFNRLVGEFYKPETNNTNKKKENSYMWVLGLQTNARAYCLQFSVIVFPVSYNKKKTRPNDREVKFKRTIRIWEILESFCIVDMRSVLFCYLKFNATLVRFEPFVGIERKS